MLSGGVFRIKPHQPTSGAVEILEKADDRHIRPDLFQKGQLSPAGMADDDVGFEALLLLQLPRRQSRADAIAGRGFPILGQPIGVSGGLVVAVVADGFHPRQLHIAPLGEKDNLMKALIGQPLDHFPVLTGHVLMHKKKFHRPILWRERSYSHIVARE